MDGNFFRSNSPTTVDLSAAAPQADSGRTSPRTQAANQITDSSTLTTTTVPAASQDQQPTYAEVTSGKLSPSSSDRSRGSSPESKSPDRLKQFFGKFGAALKRKSGSESAATTKSTNNAQAAHQSPTATSETGASNASFMTATPREREASTASSRDDVTVINTTSTTSATADSTSTDATLSSTTITATLNGTITTKTANREAQNAAELAAQERAELEAAQREAAQRDAERQAAAEARRAQEEAEQARLAQEAAQNAASGQTQGDADKNKQPSAPNADTQGADAAQAPQTPTTPKKTVSCFKKHMKLIIISLIAVVLAGLIAAPFIYDYKKTLAVLNSGLEATNSLVGKTGFSKLTLGGIALGVILAIALITLIAFYIKGKNTMKEASKTTTITAPAAPTSFDIPELAKEMNLTINFNPNDLATTKAFEEKKDELRQLIDTNIDESNIFNILIINMGDIASTDQNALTIAQKLVDNINLCDYLYYCTIYCQFNDGFFFVDESNKKLENLNPTITYISDDAKKNPNTRIVNITLSENKEQQQEIKPNIKTDTMAVKVYHDVNKVLNFATCNIFKLETKVTV